MDRSDRPSDDDFGPLPDEMVHELGVDHAIRLDLNVVFDVVSFGVIHSRGWMKVVEFVERVDANGCCQHHALVLEGRGCLRAGVHDTVFGGVLLGSAFSAVSRDCPIGVNETSGVSDGGDLQGTARFRLFADNDEAPHLAESQFSKSDGKRILVECKDC